MFRRCGQQRRIAEELTFRRLARPLAEHRLKFAAPSASAPRRRFARPAIVLWALRRLNYKVVYSSTLTSVPEPRTRLEPAFDPEAVRALKAAAGQDIAISGAGLATEAIHAGLADRYQLLIVPTIVGAGTRALPDAAKVNLALTAEHRFANGTVMLDYRLR